MAIAVNADMVWCVVMSSSPSVTAIWDIRYLYAGGRHLSRLVVDLESVPVRCQRVVADQLLDGCILDLSGVKVDAPVGVSQCAMASWETLWC